MTRPAVRVAAVLLAGGESRRMGGLDKRTLTVDGLPLVRRWLDLFRDAGIADVIVVVGHQPQRILPLLEGSSATVVLNERWPDGQQSSVLAGLRALPEGVDAAMVVLVDLVLVDAGDLRELIDAFAARPAGTSLLVPFHGGQRGNPVIASAEVVARVLEAGQDSGGLREYLRTHPTQIHRHEARSDHFLVDLDTPEDVARVERRLGSPIGRGVTGEAQPAGAQPDGRRPTG